jgi:hypothetical protein
MKRLVSLTLIGAIFVSAAAFAADPVVGTWKLNVAKSTFNPGPALKAATRTYTEAGGVYTMDQKVTMADGKEAATHVQYKEGGEMKMSAAGSIDSGTGKKVDANTWDFELKSAGKVVGKVHRVVSADGKTLTVHNTGLQPNGRVGDDTLVFDRQ